MGHHARIGILKVWATDLMAHASLVRHLLVLHLDLLVLHLDLRGELGHLVG